jgi:predicted small lipoprotein YifL
MKTGRNMVVWLLLLAILPTLIGCGKKADESKPMSEVKAEAEKMSADDLRANAMAYKKAIAAKKGEVEKLAAQLKEIAPTEMVGEKATKLKADTEKLQKSIAALQERFKVYYDKLKEKGGDLSGLEL